MTGEGDHAAREEHVTFRPLRRDDLLLLLNWLGDPDVAAWYDEGELTLANLERRYGPKIDRTEPVAAFIIQIDQRPAGYIQTYVIGDFPEYVAALQLEPDFVATDLFLGEAGIRGHGWGTPVLRAFHRRIVFGAMRADRAMIAPSTRNARAIHVYGRAGFRPLKVMPVFDPDTGRTEDELVMTLSRDGFHAGKRDQD